MQGVRELHRVRYRGKTRTGFVTEEGWLPVAPVSLGGGPALFVPRLPSRLVDERACDPPFEAVA